MKPGLREVTIMNKPLSTYERKMKDPKFKKAYQQSYKELLFSELMISIMEGDDKSVRQLAKEAHLSPSVIQDIRSGKQHDIKVSNLIKIAHAFGYEVILEKKGKERLTLQEKTKNSKAHLSMLTAC
jgi:transcriptional regulator with XRE-family HTH domain